MKRFLILVTVAAVATSLLAGCACGIKTYKDSGQTISIGVDQEFVIALGSNPTTGYGWQESHDETILELVEQRYEPGEEAEQGVVGAGGVEYFRFKALKAGKTQITLVYKRPFEEEFLEQKVFTVDIK
ncbi:MAG: protease inhibitor I42 family protein [Dehalococcoidia bacterium]|nr:protease inhibitor I42 family protein [Dehalococcoidia bacterium]